MVKTYNKCPGYDIKQCDCDAPVMRAISTKKHSKFPLISETWASPSDGLQYSWIEYAFRNKTIFQTYLQLFGLDICFYSISV